VKLAAYYEQGGTRQLGVLTDPDHLVNLSSLYGHPALWAQPDPLLALLQADQDTWETLRHAVEQQNSPAIPLSSVKLDAPLRSPSKIICVGLNYDDHCREQNVPRPDSPILFVKFPSAIIGHETPITWPPEVSQQVDYEAELALVIGKKAHHVRAEDAYDVIAGYTIVNDVSARDVQFSDKQWVRGKSFDTFCPMGPTFVTADEIDDPQNLGIRCWLNGEIMQDSNTFEMIFDIPTLIEFITRTCTLLPGDMISTGTPDGVGVFRKPPVFLKPGDVVKIEIDGLGCLRNPVE
jgi:2-keto-4-pentenoate hydratase/2-oxohepta-3-ene-1,7-dioic acid hydratase in catechol pathway